MVPHRQKAHVKNRGGITRMASKPRKVKKPVQRSATKKTVRKTVKRMAKRTSTSTRRTTTTATQDANDLSRDVLHGSMKPLMYSAVMKRLRKIT